MKPWICATLCLVCAAATGCRSNLHRTAVEQESRQWEDRYYIVQDRLEQCQDMLDAALERNCELEQAAGRPGMSPSSRSGSSAKGESPASIAPPSIEGFSPERFQPTPPDTLGPESSSGSSEPIDAGSVAPLYSPQSSGQSPSGVDQEPALPEAPRFEQREFQSPAVPGEPRRLETPELPGIDPDASQNGAAIDDGLPAVSDNSRRVSRIAILSMPRDGYNADGRGGDDGVQFIVQPRDERERPIAAAGEISVVVVDPQPGGKSVRVARWDLTARQAAGYHDRSPQGFHLRLPWPASEPENSQLRLFVRYTTADGRKIQAQKAITVDMDGDIQPSMNAVRQIPSSQPRVASQPYQRRTLAEPTTRQPVQSEPPRRQRPVWSPQRP